MRISAQTIVKSIPLSRSPRLQDWVCFAKKIASFLNQESQLVPPRREVKIFPLPMRYKGKRAFTLSFEFISQGSGVNRETMSVPNALAKTLATRGIKEICFLTGIQEKQILGFISQVQTPDSTISNTSDIRVYFNTGSLEAPSKEDQ